MTKDYKYFDRLASDIVTDAKNGGDAKKIMQRVDNFTIDISNSELKPIEVVQIINMMQKALKE